MKKGRVILADACVADRVNLPPHLGPPGAPDQACLMFSFMYGIIYVQRL